MAAKNIPHATHGDIIKRLRRAEGHLRTVIAMIEQERPCLDLAQQLHAVEKSINVAKKTLIHDHIEHCLAVSTRRTSPEAAQAFDEFKEITKYL